MVTSISICPSVAGESIEIDALLPGGELPLNASSSQERQQLNSDILQFRSTCRTNHDCHWIEQYQKAVEIYIKYGASAGFCRGYNCVNDEIAEWVARQKNQMKDCDATKQKLLKRIGL